MFHQYINHITIIITINIKEKKKEKKSMILTHSKSAYGI